MKADHESIVLTLPDTLDIDAMLPEWAFGALKKQGKNLGMVRVIHAEQVLSKARYRETVSCPYSFQMSRLRKTTGCSPYNTATDER